MLPVSRRRFSAGFRLIALFMFPVSPIVSVFSVDPLWKCRLGAPADVLRVFACSCRKNGLCAAGHALPLMGAPAVFCRSPICLSLLPVLLCEIHVSFMS